jgi:NSS family neurotransmitter:Na+ symporter
MVQNRGQWNSTIGFVLAGAGSAIGLGNIWRFPYITGQNGGAAFVLLYLACVVVVCVPYLFAELALGRTSQRSPIEAIRFVKNRTAWFLVGGLCTLTALLILSYYAVIAGWTLGYVYTSATGGALSFGDFAANGAAVVPLTAAFIGLTVLVVVGGVEHGIERWSKVLMPVLLGLMALVILRGLTLEGAMAGVDFFLKTDFSKVTGRTVLAALGQAFYSLSLGMGIMITYGSYLPKRSNLPWAGLSVAFFDTALAILAGFMIFPAVFAMGRDPAEGPSLVFQVLPEIFAEMPLGPLFATVFFLLFSIAALTSTVSLLEVPVSALMDEKGWSRRRSVAVVAVVVFLLGIPSALSQGAHEGLTNLQFMGQTTFLGIMDFVWGNLMVAVGALLMCLFIGWVWGIRRAADEIREGGALGDGALRVWSAVVRYVTPLVIVVVLLNVFGVFE